jgi:hypothetical protein
MSRAVARVCEWLPEIVHLNIFVLERRNANEPAPGLQLRQNFGSSLLLVV